MVDVIGMTVEAFPNSKEFKIDFLPITSCKEHRVPALNNSYPSWLYRQRASTVVYLLPIHRILTGWFNATRNLDPSLISN